MTFTELKDNLSYMYCDFFEDMKIDSKTGIVIGNNLRFSELFLRSEWKICR